MTLATDRELLEKARDLDDRRSRAFAAYRSAAATSFRVGPDGSVDRAAREWEVSVDEFRAVLVAAGAANLVELAARVEQGGAE